MSDFRFSFYSRAKKGLNRYRPLDKRNCFDFREENYESQNKLLKDKKFKEKIFCIIGFIKLFRYFFIEENNKKNSKIKVILENFYFKKYFKNNDDYIDIYIHPIEKITTQIREY